MESKSNPKLLTYWLAFGLEMIKTEKNADVHNQEQMVYILFSKCTSCFTSAKYVCIAQ